MTPLPRFANLALKRCSDNRELAFSMSAARVRTAVGPLPNRPVPREMSLVAVCGTEWGDDDSPDVTSDHEPELPHED